MIARMRRVGKLTSRISGTASTIRLSNTVEPYHRHGCWHTGSCCFFQVSVHKGDGHRPLARGGGDALDRAIAHVPYHTTLEGSRESPRHRRRRDARGGEQRLASWSRRSGSRQPCDPSSPRRNTSRSGGPPPPQRHAVVDQSSAKLDLH